MNSDKIFIEADSAYENGDYIRALLLFKKLADEDNNADAMSRIAIMFFDGEGVEKDLEKSIEWDLKAIEAGSFVSYSNLAITYRCMGQIKKAKDCFLKAIDQGDHDAALELANLYMVSDLENDKIIEFLTLVSQSQYACEDSIEAAKVLLKDYTT